MSGPKVKKCPKCGGLPVAYIELWRNHGILFHTTKEGYVDDVADEQYSGYPYCVEAICGKCTHQWRLRGVLQISQLRDDGEA